MRKTARLKTLIEQANDMLTNSSISQDTKKGIAMMIENVLHDCDAYSGYNNFKWSDRHNGMTSCGTDDAGYQEWTRIYYAPRGLDS